jgi:GxxExxY protein
MNTEEHGCIDSLTERVLGAVFEVSNTLGAGFLEKVYERALVKELAMRGIRATAQASFAVNYKGQSVGEYFADLLVEDELVGGAEMCGAPHQRAHRAMSQLPARLRSALLSAHQLPET